MIGLAIRLFGLAAPKWLTPWVKWAVDIGIVIALLAGLWALHSHMVSNVYNTAFNDGWNKQKVLTDREIAKNAINLKSIADLQAIIAEDNRQSDARAKAYADSKAEDAATIKEMDRRAQGTDAVRARLEAISRIPGGSEACKAPKAVADALAGL